MRTTAAASRYRFKIFALLFFALINYIDRGALSFAASAIAQEYRFTGAARRGTGLFRLRLSVRIAVRRLSRRSLRHQKGLADGGRALVCAGDPHRTGRRHGAGIVRRLGDYGLRRAARDVRLCRRPAYALMNKAIAHWAPDNERGMALGIGLLSTQSARY